jgi:LysR family transcriptional regulator, glycine cleavage system transcriptional activator
MARRLPPLKAVRAFEAAARHLSFERAGDELAVTAGAIAQQVKSLEAWLGLPVFHRLPSRGVTLTPAGRRYADSIGVLLDGLADATARVQRQDDPNTLTVSTMPSFAANWLIPRLGSLRITHPALDVRVQILPGRTDFARENVDLAIRFGHGRYQGLRSDFLLKETFFPVCSAALMNDPARPLREPADLSRHTLLHEDIDPGIPEYIDWARWLASAGVAHLVDASHGPRFSHTFLALQAAASGQGIALATSVLAEADLGAGRLVRPFAHEVEGTYQYWIVCPEATADRPQIVALRSWLLEQAAAMRKEVPLTEQVQAR